MDPQELRRDVGELVDAWCDRRCLRALRQILTGYPLTSGLTDDWGNLLQGLENVRAFARSELTDDEADRVERLIAATSKIVYRLPRAEDTT